MKAANKSFSKASITSYTDSSSVVVTTVELVDVEFDSVDSEQKL